MKKKDNSKQQDEKFKKFHQEKEFIKKIIEDRFKSAEGIGVDTDYKEVSLMVNDEEYFSKTKSFSTEAADFKLEDNDSMMLSLKLSYKIK